MRISEWGEELFGKLTDNYFCIFDIRVFRKNWNPSLSSAYFYYLSSFFIYHIFTLFLLSLTAGHGSKEQLPMVIRVPKIIKTALSICERPYSLLGFGDILLPGKVVGPLLTVVSLLILFWVTNSGITFVGIWIFGSRETLMTEKQGSRLEGSNTMRDGMAVITLHSQWFSHMSYTSKSTLEERTTIH